MFHVPNDRRIRTSAGPWNSDDTYGNNGCFLIVGIPGRPQLFCIASDGEGWEHVSVSLANQQNRCPSWTEVCKVKDVFWDAEDVVMQLHPRQSDYVNVHKGCLHLWRPTTGGIPTPPSWMVGPKC